MLRYARLSTLLKQRPLPLCRNISLTTPDTFKTNSPPFTTVYVSVRSYIRPRHYDRSSSLSNAMKRQNNPFHQIGRAVNNMDPNKVLWSVIGVNVGVFGLWQYGISSYKQFGDPEWLNFMLKHFMNSPDAWQNGRWHTLLTSAFSHKNLDHLGINMLVLYSIGQGVMEAVGASRFLLLYCGAGIAGSVATLVYQKYLRPVLVGGSDNGRSMMHSPPSMGSLGASGSVMGLTTFFACAFPKATFLVFFVIPMPAIAVVGLFAAYDVYKATTLNTGIVDSAAHIGGVSYGAAYWFLRVKPLLRAGRWRV
ncbi:hypothetical protein BCR42DRAFT_166150 [Absidia repens]|uniref:Peptidase S54 rhomboid domain-containing protein n=1 Tax=Absidia repens TaxID=90262 RepID=A0A1X2IU41_9FUNG|nr:hypothetical protein BCR42DRAFT_166150 [Absidia repens]